MFMRFAVLLGVLLVVFSANVRAEKGCESPQTQADMNICSAKAYESADKELNSVYQKALVKLKDLQPNKTDDFKKIQQAWIKFRDLNCKYASGEYEGGSIAPMIYSDCMETLTKQRTEQIPALFAEWE